MANEEDYRGDLLKHLANIEKYLRIIMRDRLREVISEELAEPKNKRIYEMTGEATRDEIVEETEISAGAISALWQSWEEMGFLEKEGRSYKKIL